MIALIARRAAGLALTLLAIATLSFALLRVAPGGPFDSERNVPPEVERALEEHFGLGQPFPVQLGRWLARLAQGDLGPSFRYRGRTVNEILAAGAPASASIGLVALEISIVAGILGGAIAAARPRGLADRTVAALSALATTVPNFVFATVFLAVFCLGLRLVPVAGYGGAGHLFLCAATLALPHAAAIARLARASLLETLSQDFIRTARAKGLSETTVILRHALRPALAPVAQYLGPAAAALATGSLAVEAVFNVPGIGAHFVSAAQNRDYTLVLGTVLVYSALLLAFNAAAEIAAAWLDPRSARDA